MYHYILILSRWLKKYHKTTNNEYLYQSYNDLIIDGLKQHKTKIQKIDGQ